MPETLLFCSICKKTFAATEIQFSAGEVKDRGPVALLGIFEACALRCPYCNSAGYLGLAPVQKAKEVQA
jgi:DNA-directed RNA polymerase subunit RPC12/RpoP